jgi:hypothetical protein
MAYAGSRSIPHMYIYAQYMKVDKLVNFGEKFCQESSGASN